jgi:hypothetical protein
LSPAAPIGHVYWFLLKLQLDRLGDDNPAAGSYQPDIDRPPQFVERSIEFVLPPGLLVVRPMLHRFDRPFGLVEQPGQILLLHAVSLRRQF